jgi:hypothetical protein
MVFARISQVSLAHGARRNPFDRRWLGSIALIVAGTTLAAMGLGALLTGQPELLLEQIAEGMRWVGILFLYAISLPWLLLTWLARPLGPLIARLLPQVAPTPAATVDPYLAPEAAPLPTPIAPIVPISTEMQVLIFWLVVIVLFAALLLARRRLRGGLRSATETEASSLPADWRQLWRGLLRQGAQGMTNLANRWRGASARLAAARIRRIYTRLLRLSADLGRPRPLGATPLEFLAVLGEVFPAYGDNLALITAAYERVRYGDLPETPAEVEAVEAAWRPLRAEGLRQRRARLGELKTAAVEDARQVKM